MSTPNHEEIYECPECGEAELVSKTYEHQCKDNWTAYKYPDVKTWTANETINSRPPRNCGPVAKKKWLNIPNSN